MTGEIERGFAVMAEDFYSEKMLVISPREDAKEKFCDIKFHV